EGAHHAEGGNGVGLEAVEARAAVADLAGGRLAIAGDGIEGRGLAGAVGTDEGEHLARAHLEAGVLDGAEAAEADRQTLDRELCPGPATSGARPARCRRAGSRRRAP